MKKIYMDYQVYDLEQDIAALCEVKASIGPEKGEDAGRAVFGVWKPVGMSSFDVLRILKRECGFEKIGHGGTLDPMAEGVMIVGVGRGTKGVWNVGQDKTYRAEFVFGASSDSLDLVGVVSVADNPVCDTLSYERRSEEEYKECVAERRGMLLDAVSGVAVCPDVLQEMIPEFTGTILQVPPKYSAKKIDGKRAYDLVRSGADVVMKTCEVEIFSIDDIAIDGPIVRMTIHCGKGTYIRSLGDDIARAMEYEGAVMTELVRIQSGEYKKAC